MIHIDKYIVTPTNSLTEIVAMSGLCWELSKMHGILARSEGIISWTAWNFNGLVLYGSLRQDILCISDSVQKQPDHGH